VILNGGWALERGRRGIAEGAEARGMLWIAKDAEPRERRGTAAARHPSALPIFRVVTKIPVGDVSFRVFRDPDTFRSFSMTVTG
jgi:hypothetical protein